MAQSSFLIFLISTGLGFLSGSGIGGGSLLLICLTEIVGLGISEAKTVNLLFFIPSASMAIYKKRKEIPFRKLLPAILWGCIFSFLGGKAGFLLPLPLVRKLFGGLLIIIGLKELFYQPRKAR